MSAYQFAPIGIRNLNVEPFVFWEKGFTEDELDTIESYCDTLPISPAVISDKGIVDENYRKSKTAWVRHNDNTSWFYDKMAYICRSLNSQFYGFDMWGFSEDFQYTVYDGAGEGYGWHVDLGVSGSECPRKLSMVLQLTDPSEYEGGDLQIMQSNDIINIKKERGFVTLFPSYLLHRVTPLISGKRKTIVIWATGPSFK